MFSKLLIRKLLLVSYGYTYLYRGLFISRFDVTSKYAYILEAKLCLYTIEQFNPWPFPKIRYESSSSADLNVEIHLDAKVVAPQQY